MKSNRSSPHWQRTLLALLLVLLSCCSVFVSVDRVYFEVDRTGGCGNGLLLNRNPHIIGRWKTATEHGWPLKTFETYWTDWDAGVNAKGRKIVVSDQMKSLDRIARRSLHATYQELPKSFRDLRLRTYDQSFRLASDSHGPYRPASDCPYESGENFYPGAVIANIAIWVIVLGVLTTFLSMTRRSVITLLNRERRRRGICTHCRYDLRGSLESGRCPECGTSWVSRAPAESSALLPHAS